MSNRSSMVCLAKRALKKHTLDLSAAFLLAVASLIVIAPRIASADMRTDSGPSEKMIALQVHAMQNETAAYGRLPVVKSLPVPHTLRIPITAYNSESGQTDATPCIAARGFDLCAHNEEDVVAANFLPIGAQVKIPELYGDRVFTVVDRMNPRYYYRMDVWMREKETAKHFGVKYATVEVF